MLQVINLTKIYKSKNGADVHALDGVSLQFPEKGMVFLLGKSGSGKSTLLNVCGGLDNPTSGEIVVKGKSSKNFSQSDFDSYRNTFVGFIFQEYNILNEFSVEDNIALALELQGKPKDKAAVSALLKEVDLEGYGKRKPNTLSGGQKQRIAIARALIKSPEIIMADEPTGALDSKTGKQVFDTLKKLSRDKLVIVVSHDHDFAEQYADRIIELKDGKILSDVTKTQVEQTKLTENINSLGDVLCVKNGSSLTDSDFEKIKSFLKNSKDDVVIASNEKDIQNFKKVSRITDSGEKEVFAQTDPSSVPSRTYTADEARFIGSRLPLRHAVKMGLSGLKHKPVRLIFTVILCTVAFIMFGLLSTLSFYDSESTFRESMINSNNSVMHIQKEYVSEVVWYINGEESHRYTGISSTRFTPAELENMRSRFGSDVFGGINVGTSISVRSGAGAYWVPELYYFASLPEDHSLRGSLSGTYPIKDDEIALSDYTAETLYQCKIYDANGDPLELSSKEELLGKKININGRSYTVTAIFDSGEISPEYEILKSDSTDTGSLERDFRTELEDGLHLIAFVSQQRLTEMAEEYYSYVDDGRYYRRLCIATTLGDQELVFPDWANAYYMPFTSAPEGEAYVAFEDNKTAPGDNEIIVSSVRFGTLIRDCTYNIEFKDDDHAYQEKIWNIQLLADQLSMGGEWIYDDDNPEGEFVSYTDQQLTKKAQDLYKAVKNAGLLNDLSVKLFNDWDGVAFGEIREFSIIGIFLTNERSQSYESVYLNDTTYNSFWSEHKASLSEYSENTTAYVIPADAQYDNIFLPYDHSAQHTDYFWQLYTNNEPAEDDSIVTLTGSFVNNLKMVDELVKSLSQVFLYVGLVMAVFAALLFSNFISVSISHKKRDIGILRAVGARGSDVFKIFFSESFFISIICVILAAAGSITACSLINVELSEGIGASLLVFGPASLGVLIGIALLTAVVATFLPVLSASKKKPVDSIRSL